MGGLGCGKSATLALCFVVYDWKWNAFSSLLSLATPHLFIHKGDYPFLYLFILPGTALVLVLSIFPGHVLFSPFVSLHFILAAFQIGLKRERESERKQLPM